MSATLITGARFQAMDVDGPVPGALVEIYLAGGLTPVITYNNQSQAMGTENVFPVECDANGQAIIWADSVAHRIIVKTAAGVVISDDDNVPPSDVLTGELANTANAALGDALVGVNSMGTPTTLHKWIFGQSRTLKGDFGALGDGSDEGALINSAIATMHAAGGGVLYAAEGTYGHSIPIKWYSSVRVLGASQGATVFQKTGAATISIGAPANNALVCLDGGLMSDGSGNVNCSFWLDDAIRAENIEIADMTIRSNGTQATTAPVDFGIAGVGCSEARFHDVTFEYFKKASIVMPDVFVAAFERVKSYKCGQGISIEAGTALTVQSNYAIYCQKYGYYFRDISYLTIKSNACDGLNNVSNASDYTDRTIDSKCYVLNACNGVDFSTNGAEQCFGTHVYIDSCVETKVKNNCFISPASSYTGANQVALFYVNALAHGVDISDNFVYRGGTTAIQGAANAANHHDIYVAVASENHGFRFHNNWIGNQKYDAPSAIYGNNVPTYLSFLKQGAQLHGDFVPVLTVPGATGVTITPTANNKGRYSIVNGFMEVDIDLDETTVTFTGTGTITIAGLPFVNASAKSARLLIDHTSGITFASTEGYWLDIANGASSGTLKNRTDGVSGVTTSTIVSAAALYMHLTGRVYVGDIVNVV